METNKDESDRKWARERANEIFEAFAPVRARIIQRLFENEDEEDDGPDSDEQNSEEDEDK